MAYTLPSLPYAFDALEPYIDARTMEIHHNLHHQGYINKLNKALEQYPELQQRSLTELLQSLDAVPENIRTAVRNNGGGTYNHNFFWTILSPTGGGNPQGTLAKEIVKRYSSFDAMKHEFNDAAKSVFGSGWAWLCMVPSGSLEIITTANQDAPISQGAVPILGLDVWEHAYYLKYQNRRPDYIQAWWHVVNWEQAENNYKQV